jgi:hypothetical protein
MRQCMIVFLNTNFELCFIDFLKYGLSVDDRSLIKIYTSCRTVFRYDCVHALTHTHTLLIQYLYFQPTEILLNTLLLLLLLLLLLGQQKHVSKQIPRYQILNFM